MYATNMQDHKGKSAGSFYLECLSTELQRYPQIQYIYGKLSPVDLQDKDKLINFYSKNGFEDIKAMTPTESGYVKKYLHESNENAANNSSLHLTIPPQPNQVTDSLTPVR